MSKMTKNPWRYYPFMPYVRDEQQAKEHWQGLVDRYPILAPPNRVQFYQDMPGTNTRCVVDIFMSSGGCIELVISGHQQFIEKLEKLGANLPGGEDD